MFKQNRCYDNSMDASFNYNANMGMDSMQMGTMNQASGCAMPPVYECPQERVVNKEIIHEVQHICPINTRIVNHHIYRHTYAPCYTCCEENVCSDVYEGSCCNF